MENILIGAVIAYAGTEESLATLKAKGWLLCDGQLYDRTLEHGRFQNLFNAIGTSWGGDGGNKFAVPDFRGQFLRGVSGVLLTDPDKDLREPSRPDLHSQGNRGNAVGSKQSDTLQGHHHAIRWEANPSTGREPNNTDGGGERHGIYSTSLAVLGPTTDGQNGEPRISSETRPINTYVYYIIKY